MKVFNTFNFKSASTVGQIKQLLLSEPHIGEQAVLNEDWANLDIWDDSTHLDPNKDKDIKCLEESHGKSAQKIQSFWPLAVSDLIMTQYFMIDWTCQTQELLLLHGCIQWSKSCLRRISLQPCSLSAVLNKTPDPESTSNLILKMISMPTPTKFNSSTKKLLLTKRRRILIAVSRVFVTAQFSFFPNSLIVVSRDLNGY